MEIRSDLAGFRAAEQSMTKRSERIVRATLEGASPSDAAGSSDKWENGAASTGLAANSQPDFVSDVVGMTTDRLAGAYDVKAAKVRDRMLGELLDLIH